MRGKLVVSVLSFLFLFVNIVNSQTTLVNHEWISRAVSDQNHVLSQDIIGLNAINIFIVTDQNISLNDFEQYVVQESDYFLKHVPLSNRFNIFLVRVNNLGFIPQNDSTVTPSKSTRNSIEQFIKRNFDNSHDYLVYVNNFFGVGSAVVAGGNNIDYFYVSAVMSLTNQGIMAHELGHLVCNLSDENDALATGRDWQLNKLINQTQFGELATINLYGHKDYIPSAEIVNGEIINVNIVDIPREKIPWAALIEDNVPLPTWRVPHISFGKLAFGPGVFNPEDFPYQNSIGAFGDALFAPTTGACIMNIQDPRWGYCKVCEHAWIAQILAKTQEIKHSQPEGDIIIQSSGGNQTSINPILSISFLETGYNTRAYWLIDGVTNESYLNKKDWSVSEASSLINKTLTLRVISEAGLIYNPYNIFKVGHPLVDERVINKSVANLQTEDYSFQIIGENQKPLVHIAWANGSLLPPEQIFHWEDTSVFTPTGTLVPFSNSNISMLIHIPALKGIENKPEYWQLEVEPGVNIVGNPIPQIGDSQIFGFGVVIGDEDVAENIANINKFRVIVTIPPFGMFTVYPQVNSSGPAGTHTPTPTMTPTPIPPTPTPIPLTPTPTPGFIGSIGLKVLVGGNLEAFWNWQGANPDNFEIHLYTINNTFIDRVNPPLLGTARQVVISPPQVSGSYKVLIAPSYQGIDLKGSDFTASVIAAVVIEAPIPPTQTPIETSIGDWDVY